MQVEEEYSFDTRSVYDFYRIMEEQNVLMIYEGEFSQDLVKSVLQMTEISFEESDVQLAIKRRIFNVMVEMLQNICKHQYNQYEKNATAIFMVGEDEEDFLVVSGNAIENTLVERVKGKIDLVNSLSGQELKELYKRARLNSTLSEVGGAGLGFIDMARKSGKKLVYDFHELSAHHSFFSQVTKISKTELND